MQLAVQDEQVELFRRRAADILQRAQGYVRVGKSHYAPHTRALSHHKPFIIIIDGIIKKFIPYSGLV